MGQSQVCRRLGPLLGPESFPAPWPFCPLSPRHLQAWDFRRTPFQPLPFPERGQKLCLPTLHHANYISWREGEQAGLGPHESPCAPHFPPPKSHNNNFLWPLSWLTLTKACEVGLIKLYFRGEKTETLRLFYAL